MASSKRCWRLAASLIAAMIFLLGATASFAETSITPLPIRIGYTPSGFTRLYTAISLGLFEKHGLKPELIRFQSGAASAAAFKSGSIDVSFTGVPGLASARLSSDAQIFLIEADDSGAISLIAQPDSGINSVKDLAGKKVGTAIGVNAYVALMLALDKSGVQRSAVEIVNLAPPTWVPVFLSHQIDAMFCFEPANYQAIAAGGKQIATAKEYIASPIVWIGRAQFLTSADGAKAAGRFIAAMDEAGNLFEQNEDKVIGYMAELNGVSGPIMKSIVRDITNFSYAGELNTTNQWSLVHPQNGLQPIIDEYVDILLKAGVLPTRPSFGASAYNAQPLTLYVNSKLN